MAEAILAIPLVARGRPQLVSASGRPELRSGVRLLTFFWDHQGNVFLPVLMRYDG